ncbi:transglycosylase domain-containing protein [Pseudolysinimonas sp.]|uniref:transglycosylase domain-containing protein n=1 Tax=Pseudolysinimonas sp. TaxID=2680009 RepID=UPI003F7E98FF
MSAGRGPVRALVEGLGAAAGLIGLSALAGALVAVMIGPTVAVAGVTTNSAVGAFDALPDYIELTPQYEANEILAKKADGSDLHIATLYDQNRQSVPLDRMGDNVREAAIAGEDRRFYDHGGIDVPSVARAAVGQAAGTSSSGASTITMQLVRQLRLQEAANRPGVSPKQRAADMQAVIAPDLGRKVQEMKLAIGLEKKYSKQQILAAYLNIVGMGGNTYGVEAAAHQYFSVSAADLTIAQAASIIAIVQNPSTRNLSTPANYAANQERRDVILGFMRDEGYITPAEERAALATKVDARYVKPSSPAQGCLYATPGYQFICDLVDTSVRNGEVASIGSTPKEAQAHWREGGYKVYVSIQPAMQDAGNATIKGIAPPTESRFALGAAAATVQPGTGRILMEVQNKDFDNRPTDTALSAYDLARTRPTTAINLAEDAAHGGGGGYQPGSSFKPYTLLAYLAAGHHLNDVVNASVTQYQQSRFLASCSPNVGAGFKVTNDEANEVGPMTVTQGTARSVNTVFMQMAQRIDQCSTKAIAESLGVHNSRGDAADPLKTLPACVIGACQTIAPITQAAAYAAIAAGGTFCSPTIVDAVVTRDGARLPGQDAKCAASPLLTPEVVHTAAYAMQQVFTKGGTAVLANPQDGTTYMGKTGTTDSSHQTWTVGSSTAASTALWVGNIIGPGGGVEPQQLRKISVGGTLAASLRNLIFRGLARAIDAQPGFAGGAFPSPDPTLVGQRQAPPSSGGGSGGGATPPAGPGGGNGNGGGNGGGGPGGGGPGGGDPGGGGPGGGAPGGGGGGPGPTGPGGTAPTG